jgi:hypothetical protein
MRLTTAEHTTRDWRIHEYTKDFEVEDVWRMPTPGGPDDLERLVRLFATAGKDGSRLAGVVRALFAIRWKLGAAFGWDKEGTGVGARVRSLRERLPADLRDGRRGPDLPTVPFTSVYQTHDEWAAESANATVHAVMHIGWVPDESGTGYHAQMAVLVKPNGQFGSVYMKGIVPLRRALVYPSLFRTIGNRWRTQTAG